MGCKLIMMEVPIYIALKSEYYSKPTLIDMRSIQILFCLLMANIISAQTPIIPPPTQTDAIIIDLGTPGSADPNDRIRYTVTIPNTGTGPANDVQLNAMLDPRTTLVPGSFKTSPLAANDSYASTGNVGINVPAGSGVKSNDYDDAIAAATPSCGACLSANGGSVMMNADGSFMYSPPAGFTGTDNFTYTLTDSNPVGAPVPSSDMATVTITVSNLIWFVDNSAAAGDGRLSSPFNSLTAFNGGSATAGDVVYLEHTGTDYTGGIVLQAGERLYGEGHSGGVNLSAVLPFALPIHSKTLPTLTAANRPTITNGGGIGITLATNNQIRGLNVGATTGAKISGTNFGTLRAGDTTTPDVSLFGNGQALNLTNGSFDVLSKFISVTTTSSTVQGILISQVGGTVAFGSTTVSGNATQGILINQSTATIDFGNTSVTAGTDAVSLQNNSAGTRTFGSLTTSGNSGSGFLHGVGGGTTTVTGAASITNPGGTGIDIQSSATSVTFAGTTVNKGASTGIGVNLGGVATGNTGAVFFSTLSITTSAGAGLSGNNNTGQLTVNLAAGSNITSAGGPAININRTGSNSPVTLNFTNVGTTSSPTNGISFTNVSGTFSATGGTLSGTTGAAFLVTGGTITSAYGGTITGNSGLAVDIDNHDSNNITFQTGNIISTTQGIRVQNSGGGTITFDNPSKNLNTAANTAVNLLNNTGATINFTGGGLVLSTTTGTGFNATGGGTVSVTGASNTINSTSATALNVNATTIAAAHLNFLSISAGNNTVAADPGTGIALNTTGASGGLKVTGTGTTNASGGTIQNITNRGVDAFTTNMLALSNMAFTNANLFNSGGLCGAVDNSGCNAAIHLNTVTTVTLDNIDISGTTAQQGINAREVSTLKLLNSTIINAGSGGGSEVGGLYALNLFGISEITNTSITFPGGRGVTIYNISKTLTLDVTSSNFDDTQSSAVGADGFEISTFGTSNTTIDILNSFFRRNKTNGLQTIAEDNSVMSLDMQGNTFDYGTFAGGGGGIDIDAADNGDVDFNIIGNTLFKGALTSVVNIFAQGNSTMEGRFSNNPVQVVVGSGTGIRAVAQESADMKIEIANNTITGVLLDNGIELVSRAGDGRMDATVSGNNITVGSAGSTANSFIRSAAGASGSAFTNKTCAWIKNNTVNGTFAFSHHEGRVVNAHELILQGGGASMAASWNINTNNPASPPSVMNPLVSGAGIISFAGVCTAPANPAISF